MDLQLRIDLEPLLRLGSRRMTWPTLRAQVQMELQLIQQVWAAAVYGGMLPGMTKRIYDEAYRNAITSSDALEYPLGGNALAGAVIARYEGVDRIEHGYASFDLKPGLLRGPKSRPLRDGTGRYNIVPFRHGTPGSVHFGAMPAEVYQAIRRGAASIGGIPLEEYGLRAKVPAGVNLQWRARNPQAPDVQAPMQAPYVWRTGPFAGMRRIVKPGIDRPHSVQYMTFRTVSTPRVKTITRGPRRGQTVRLGSDPNSWIHPGQPPNPIMQAVRDFVFRDAERRLREAAETDLRAWGIDIG